MRNFYLIAALLFSVPAWAADGVPLIVKGGGVNKYALDSNVITINVAGKEYRFVGSGKPVDHDPLSTIWSGTAPEGTVSITRSRLGINARLQLGKEGVYTIVSTGGPAEIQKHVRQGGRVSDEPTPAEIEAWRKPREFEKAKP